jgi:hypothetical protein
MKPRSRGPDDGQIMLMIIAYVLVALLMITVIVDITAVHLQRERLFALSDAAALDAADALDQTRFYRVGAGAGPDRIGSIPAVDPVPISDQTVLSSAQRYVQRAGALSRVSAVRVGAPTGSPDGVTARVTLVGRARLPMLSFVVAAWSGGVPLTATSQARARSQP